MSCYYKIQFWAQLSCQIIFVVSKTVRHVALCTCNVEDGWWFFFGVNKANGQLQTSNVGQSRHRYLWFVTWCSRLLLDFSIISAARPVGWFSQRDCRGGAASTRLHRYHVSYIFWIVAVRYNNKTKNFNSLILFTTYLLSGGIAEKVHLSRTATAIFLLRVICQNFIQSRTPEALLAELKVPSGFAQKHSFYKGSASSNLAWDLMKAMINFLSTVSVGY